VLVLVVLGLLSAAMRQKQQAELSWLTEPVETPPKRLYAMHGLLAVLSFLFIRDAAQIGLALAQFNVPQILTIAFCGSALIVGVISWLWARRTGIAVLPATSAAPVWRPLVLSLIVTCLTGLVWISVLRHFQVLGSASVNLFSASGGYESWLMAGMIILVAPLFEEWVFRGLLYQSLRRTWGVAASVGLSSLLFTVIHPLESSVAVLVLGIVTALLVEKTGRLWPSMLVHMGYNAFVMGLWTLAM
jgi:membrane protease YdiL (CAAX protease family)